MRRLLYIGNNLKGKQTNITYMQTLGPLLERQGFKVYYASSQKNKFLRLFSMLWSCFRLRRKVDKVLIDTYSTSNFYYALFVSQLCRVLGLSYVSILHGGNLEKRLLNYPKLSRLLFVNATSLVSPSLYLKEIFKKHGYKEVKFIPNSIQLDKYVFKTRSINNCIDMLWVRSFSKIYNPHLAIKVLKTLQDLGYESTLCMVGPDSDGSIFEVEKLAKDLQVRVNFTGKLLKKNWHKLSNKYNVFINTTNFDNMPVSVIEVMALGLPIVSTNVGGIPYLIENGKEGLLVPPKNPNALVEAIIKLKRNPQLTKKLAVNARTKVETFDWEKVKLLWFELLS